MLPIELVVQNPPFVQGLDVHLSTLIQDSHQTQAHFLINLNVLYNTQINSLFHLATAGLKELLAPYIVSPHHKHVSV